MTIVFVRQGQKNKMQKRSLAMTGIDAIPMNAADKYNVPSSRPLPEGEREELRRTFLPVCQ